MAKAKDSKNGKDGKEETKHSEGLLTIYRERLKILKQAQEYSAKGEVPKAVEKYSHYLGILASYYKTSEPALSPKLFDPVKDITEMLLISHAYWDLAKSYDRSPKLQKECIRCLQQFIAFTLGHKFQHVNAQMLKKFLKGSKVYNRKAFEQALARINVESKACFIATYAYPDNDYNILSDLRSFKNILLNYKLGTVFVDFYYFVGPIITNVLEKSSFVGTGLKVLLIRPILRLTHKVVRVLL